MDSFTVNFIFLYKNPQVFSGTVGDLVQLTLGVYVVKVLIALVDTPLCYVGVRWMERLTGVRGADVV